MGLIEDGERISTSFFLASLLWFSVFFLFGFFFVFFSFFCFGSFCLFLPFSYFLFGSGSRLL